jgi:hypothetical protein
MTLWQFITLPQNTVFFYSITIFLVIAILEVISMLIGLSISEFIDDILPDFGIDADVDLDVDLDVGVDADMDIDADVDVSVGVAPHLFVLDWLNLGKIPFMVLIVLNLLSYGLSGYMIQKIMISITDTPMSKLYISLLALIPALIITHYLGRGVAKIFPKEETTAVKIETLINGIGEITIGTATHDNPAEAKVKDKYDKTHYIRVVPINKEMRITQGEKIVIIELNNGVFSVDKFEV